MPTKTWIEIDDPEVTADELAERVDSRLAARPPERPVALLNIPPYGSTGALPSLPEDLPHFFDLLHHLRALTGSYYKIETRPILAPSPATRLPLVGPLWGKLRHFAHELVLFYVNRVASHQTSVNHQLTQVAGEMARLQIRMEREITALRDEIDRLKAGQDQA